MGSEDGVILGVMNVDSAVRTEQATRTYNAIAQSLANRYATIYYVDLNTDHYIEYSSSAEYKDLEILPEGDDFFNESRRNILRVIHPDDQEKILKDFDKETMVKLTADGKKYSLAYRLIINEVAHHVRLSAVRAVSGNNLIIALDNIDVEVQRDEELKEANEKNVIFTQIAESLAMQYGMIYYINAETDEYIEFTSTDEYREFNISPTGGNFFGVSQRNVSMIVHPSDRERVFNALNKQTLLNALKEKNTFTITYQLLLNGGSSYTRMSVVWASDKKHLIMGIMDINSEIQRENTLKKMLAENEVFSQIAESLANQYDTIYYVDMLSDHYMEFASTDVYKSLEVRPSGDDFFAESLRNIDRVIYPDDREAFHHLLDKPTLVRELLNKHMINHTYRLLIRDGVMYARMSIIWATDNKHLIVGVMNVDQEVKKEQEVQQQLFVANEKANRDDLTGVKSKHAYTDEIMEIDQRIAEDYVVPFSVLVCDVNGLKSVNDTLGHQAGDQLIRDAAQIICAIFKHSPVFRVGGDEFVAILRGQDYEHRARLIGEMHRQNESNMTNAGVVIANGIADFDPERDHCVADVFARADEAMYENKTALKSAPGQME